MLYLSKRQPPEILADGDFILNANDDISVSLSEETRPLLALQLIKNYLLCFGVFEIVKIGGTLSAMNTRIVASCSLKRWRKLHTVHVARLNLCLEQKVKDAVELFANDSKVSDFGLIDDWLFPPEDPILILVNIYPDNRKELP